MALAMWAGAGWAGAGGVAVAPSGAPVAGPIGQAIAEAVPVSATAGTAPGHSIIDAGSTAAGMSGQGRGAAMAGDSGATSRHGAG
ncbi:hypothetical protein CKO24_14700, partial [Rhodothalassium salexigens DSM 2132]|nr:hypothetical protein [Rhodothalassium salexigens DSM 2132]